MKLDGIIPLYKKLKSDNKTYGVFKYTKNKIDFDIFFDIGNNPFKIGFLVLRNNFQLWIDINNGFIINPILDKTDFINLIKILDLKYDPLNKFSTKDFFEEFNSKIPSEFRLISKQELTRLITLTFEIEESYKVYYNGLLDWDEINNGKNRKAKNLEKTRLLYPKLYEKIKDRNISVRYTSLRNKDLEKEIE